MTGVGRKRIRSFISRRDVIQDQVKWRKKTLVKPSEEQQQHIKYIWKKLRMSLDSWRSSHALTKFQDAEYIKIAISKSNIICPTRCVQCRDVFFFSIFFNRELISYKMYGVFFYFLFLVALTSYIRSCIIKKSPPQGIYVKRATIEINKKKKKLSSGLKKCRKIKH